MKPLHTSYPLTPQQALENVFTHFITNEQPAGYSNGNGHCTYFGNRGQKCAIGCQLPDEVAQQIEKQHYGATIKGLIEDNKSAKTISTHLLILGDVEIEFYIALQSAHDYSADRIWANDYSADGTWAKKLDDFRKSLLVRLNALVRDHNTSSFPLTLPS